MTRRPRRSAVPPNWPGARGDRTRSSGPRTRSRPISRRKARAERLPGLLAGADRPKDARDLYELVLLCHDRRLCGRRGAVLRGGLPGGPEARRRPGVAQSLQRRLPRRAGRLRRGGRRPAARRRREGPPARPGPLLAACPPRGLAGALEAGGPECPRRGRAEDRRVAGRPRLRRRPARRRPGEAARPGAGRMAGPLGRRRRPLRAEARGEKP